MSFSQKNIHHRWNNDLKKYVSNNGNVNYKLWNENKSNLDAYINLLSKFPPEDKSSKSHKISFWINAYNALTVKLILSNYPLNSIKEINSPWKTKCFKSRGVNYSLDDIEHKILRKLNEPRIHFAINCASKSCPKLLNEAYTEKKLNNQLNEVTISFLNDNSKNKLDENKSAISKIFLWYGSDFGSKKMMLDFISRYSKINIQRSKLNYLPYNWELNE